MINPVIINATNLGHYIDGLGMYTLNLIRELAQMKTNLSFIIYVNTSAKEHLRAITFGGNCELRWATALISPDYRFFGHLLRLLYAHVLAIMHPRSLMFVSTQLEAVFFRKNQVLTIHDIIPLLFRKSHKKQYFYYKYLLGPVLRRARSVITPSHHTKDLLVHTYQLPKEKVQVIHNGVRQPLQAAASEHYEGEEEKIILFTGRLAGMKNFSGLLRAFCEIKDAVPHKLVITGHGTKRMKRKLHKFRSEDCLIEEGRVVYKGHVSSSEMERLYGQAALLVFPSFYEGFGFPPLEGMAHGCPVVVSNVSSLPEVCADAALYVDPYDVHNIASAMHRMLTDTNLRQTMIIRGVERARSFSWEDSAKRHVELFAQVVRA